MKVRKNIIIGMITGLIGMALISGGTVAYFNTSLEAANTVQSGVLNMNINELDEQGKLFEFKNIKPGDKFTESFHLKNTGTLDMKDITFTSSHEVTKGNAEFSKQLRVNAISVNGKKIVNKQTLHALQSRTKNNPIPLLDQLIVNEEEEITVEFEFVQTGKNQNAFQGNTLELYWMFEAVQADE